ncbi:hypothetical protein ScoT_51450 [Streptomyces albidoflavus]|uniref:Uncharacterized protein n=1 Tax=Streptomyces albidoflavus TaxID=1886 RepID=A0AA37C1Z7_9ACTN|nr:hypothetical protein ScoT_51450 [Streptomyces albidoflavus]
MAAHGAAHRTTLAHRAGTLLTHRTAGALLAHGAGTLLTHRARAVLALGTRTVLALRAGTVAVAAGACRKLRGTARKLRRATHVLLLLLLGRHRLRARYGGGHRSAGTILLLLRLAHSLLLLVLRGRPRGGGEFGAQVLVLTEQARQFGLDLVEEGIDLVLVIAFSEADGRELLVPHVLGGQRHLFTST